MPLWRGDTDQTPIDLGVRIVGTPVGHLDFVWEQLQSTSRVHWAWLEKVT